jgi:hypothetical protein
MFAKLLLLLLIILVILYQLSPKVQSGVDHATFVIRNCLSEKYVLPKDVHLIEKACSITSLSSSSSSSSSSSPSSQTYFQRLFNLWQKEKKYAKSREEDGIIKEDFPAILSYRGHFIYVDV